MRTNSSDQDYGLEVKRISTKNDKWLYAENYTQTYNISLSSEV